MNDHEPSAEVAGSGIDARRRVALAVILSGIFVTIMDSSIVNVAIPRTTSFGVGQMLIGVCCPYLGGILGVRRVLLLGIVVFFTPSLLAPVSPNLPAFLAMQFLSGVGSGTFIPLSMGFIARSLPTRLIIYGVAIYAMNSELSQNVAASLEGWYTENLSWRWINWQYCPVLPLMFACVWYGIPREDIKTEMLHHLDWPGMAYAGLGFGLLYAGLDQGNRLDWTNNGLVSGLLVSGALVTMVLLVRELWVARSPFLNLRLLLRHHLVLLMVLMAGYRFIILSTSYIIPSYLQTVQNFRELQVGSVLLWIALPQFAIVLPPGYLLTRVNARWVLAAGALFRGHSVFDGRSVDERMGNGRLPTIPSSTGAGSVICFDIVGSADCAVDEPSRCAHHRCAFADKPSVRRRDRYRIYADVRPPAGANPFQFDRSACRYPLDTDGRSYNGLS